MSELNEQQEAALQRTLTECLDAGRSCKTVDHAEAEATVTELYETFEYGKPRFMWADSPYMANCIIGQLLEQADSIDFDAETSESLWAKVDKSKIPDPSLARRSLQHALYGQHDIYWTAFYTFAEQHMGVKYGERESKLLSLMHRLSNATFWWWPYSHVCVMSERPTELHIDDDGRMHNEDGPAMAFKDGYAVWSVGGVRVDEQIIMHPDTQTLDQIHDEENEEIKRIRIERYGWQKYLAEHNAEVLDSCKNDIEQTKEYLMKCTDMVVLLCHCPSTARVYALEVPPETKTCAEAQEWLWNADDSRYGKARIIGRS